MPPQTPRPTPSSRRRDSSPWDSSPNCKYALPTANVQELKRELKYRPLSTDFWIPIPSRAIITAFLNATPVPLVLERDQAVRTEHKMAGLIHGVLLRHFLIRQLRVMLYDDDGGDVKGGGAAVAQRRRGSGRRQQADAEESPRRRRRSRCKAVIALLKRDVRDLEVEYIFHWFDLRSAEYMTRLKAEVEEGWERHAGPGAGMWTMRSAAPVVKRKDLIGARAPAADQTAPTADQAAPTADQGAGTRALITSRAAQIG